MRLHLFKCNILSLSFVLFSDVIPVCENDLLVVANANPAWYTASLVQNGSLGDNEVISRKSHEETVEKLKMEIQQCKDFIQTQQQLWQV